MNRPSLSGNARNTGKPILSQILSYIKIFNLARNSSHNEKLVTMKNLIINNIDKIKQVNTKSASLSLGKLVSK